MTSSIAPAPAALDDAILRTAETTLDTVGRAREAIHSVIFGQEQVVDLSLITLLTLWVLSPLKTELVQEPDGRETREG